MTRKQRIRNDRINMIRGRIRHYETAASISASRGEFKAADDAMARAIAEVEELNRLLDEDFAETFEA